MSSRYVEKEIKTLMMQEIMIPAPLRGKEMY
jgi:hypothetical protein